MTVASNRADRLPARSWQMAETLLAEGMRGIEEFRMRQLQEVQTAAEIIDELMSEATELLGRWR